MATAPLSVPAPRRAHPIRNPRFRRLWTGWTISMGGDQFYLVALPWVVLHLTGSAIAIGTMLMAAAVPRAVLMLVGGAVTDRVSARRILMSTASARAVLVGAVGALLWLGALRMPALYVLGVAFGVADAFSMPAAQAFLPSLVARDELVAANALLQATAQVTTIAGPAPAGLVIKALGAAWAFVLDAVSFLFIVAALWMLPDPPPSPKASARPSIWRAITDGVAAVRRDVPLRTFMALAAGVNVCVTGPIAVGLPYLIKIRFDSPAVYGLAVSAVAAGGLAGSTVAAVWRVQRRGVLILGVSAALGVCLGSIGLLRPFAAIAAVLALMGTCAGFANVQILAWLQQGIDPSVRGRVLSVLMLGSFGLLPVSLAVAGVLAAWSVSMLFVLAGAALLLLAGTAALNRTVRQIT